jgi:nitroreductase
MEMKWSSVAHMETSKCIRSRASVRGFRPEDVPDAAVAEILSAATQSPCAGNIQEWRFVVVKNPGNRMRLAEAAFAQATIAKAPVSVVVCADLKEIGGAYGERGQNLYSVQDAACAAYGIMLAAWEKGIGSCWVGSFNEQNVRDILVLPSHVRPLAIIPLGYPSSPPAKPKRKDLSQVMRREFY